MSISFDDYENNFLSGLVVMLSIANVNSSDYHHAD